MILHRRLRAKTIDQTFVAKGGKQPPTSPPPPTAQAHAFAPPMPPRPDPTRVIKEDEEPQEPERYVPPHGRSGMRPLVSGAYQGRDGRAIPRPTSAGASYNPAMPYLDLCDHGRPNHQDLILELREAAGLFAGAMALTPKEAWDEAIAEVRSLRSEVQDLRASLDRLRGLGDRLFPENTQGSS